MSSDTTVAAPWPTKPPWIHRAWVGPLAGLVAFVAVFGLVVAIAGAFALKVAEADRLVTAIEASEATMIDFQSSIEAESSVFGDSGATDAEKQAALAAIQQAAEQGQASVRRAGEGVAGVQVLPWHTDLAAARDSYLLHNRAWQDYLGRVAQDPAALAQPDELIDSTFMEAEVAVRDAVPDTDLLDLRQRVDVIFAPPAGAEGESGQLV